MLVESVLYYRGPEVNENARCTLLFHKVGLERKERAVVGKCSFAGLRKDHLYFVLLFFVCF